MLHVNKTLTKHFIDIYYQIVFYKQLIVSCNSTWSTEPPVSLFITLYWRFDILLDG